MAGIIIGVETSAAYSNVKTLTKSLNDLGKQGIVTESEIKKLTDEFKKKLAADDAARDAAKLGTTLDRVAKSCGMTAGQLADLRTKAGLAASSMADLNRSITLVHSSSVQSAGSMANSGASVDVLVGKVGLLAAGYISLQSAMQAIQGISSMESLKASFNGIFGDKGAEQFKYVIDAANKYGKSIEDTAGSYRKFAAAADYVGMSTESIRKIFEGTSQAITKVGGSSQDVSGALLAISQSIGKGKVMSEEFRQQFAERIPVAMELASRAMGVTSGEFQKMMEAGQVLPTEFWPKMADEMAKFSQGWQESSQTLVSDFERMKNALMQLGGNDVVQSITKVLGFFTMGTVEESAKRITSIFDDFTTKYRAIKAEASGQLSPFEAWITPIDDLKKRLDEIAAQKSSYITGMKTEIEGLTKSLADAQSKQLDFGPSGENVEVMRQKLKWFQDLLLQLTGQTHVVNVTANVDTSQLKQAQSYIQEIIKGTAEVKSRTIAAESEKLDNAVKVLGKNKADLESKLSNPNADLREKGGVAQQIEAINKDLEDAKLGYTELQKQQKKLTEQQVKDNSEVKKFNESRGGVSGSEVTHDTQKMDAERLSVARQTDAWREYQAGLKTLPEAYEVVTRAQEAETVAKNKIIEAIKREKKERSGGANDTAKYAERTSSYLEQAQDQYSQLAAMMEGDTLGAKLAGIEKRYDKAASAIRQAMIGAKGSTEELTATLEVMGASKAIEQQMAQTDAWRKSMQDAANLLGELGRMSGDPQAIYGSQMTTAKLWESDQQARIAAIQDENEREKQLGELRRVMALKEVTARADAYAGVKAVSSEYWAAERQLIEANLATVKATATDETAYKIYAAQQWDEFYKAQMEQQAQTAGSFAETLAAKWSLAFGGYKSETTKAKDSWNEMSDSIITASEGMIDGIAGGFGDMIRNIGNGTASIEDLWKNMLSRMLDMFASFVEDMIKSQLKKMLGGMFTGGTGTDTLSSSVSSISNMRDGGTGSSSGFGDILGLGKSIGKGIVDIFSSGDSSSSAFISKLSDAASIEKTVQAASPSGYTALTSGASSGGALASGASALTGTSVLGTIGTTLGVLGAIGGVVGLVASLFGGQEEEVKKTASGYNVGYKGGKATASGVDFYSDGSTVSTGASDPDIQRKISESFKDTAENLSDFAEELGFVIDVLDSFEFPTMDITEDQLDGYIRNGQNQMAFQGLMEAGLRGAFDAVLRDGEIYVDEFERLAEASRAVVGNFEGYGYAMEDVAGITQEQIDALRAKNTEVANGTAMALAIMAAAMGASASFVAQIATDTSAAAAALGVTDEQLRNILEADYASKLLDAVGGEDAFKSIMGNLTKNIFDTIDSYAENLGYYTTKADTAIGKLGDATITVDNFWEKFDEAVKGGLTVDQFEAWGKASEWVNQIDTVTEAMEDWANSMNNLEGSLEARKAEALGMSDQAKYIQLLYTAENELYEARKNNYDEAIIAKIQEVQQLEQARALYEIAKKSTQGVQALNVREMEVTGNPYADIIQAYYDNGWELQEAMESGLYSDADIARLAEVQRKEVEKLWEELADAIAEAAQDAHSRMMKSGGKTDAAELYDFQAQAVKELEDALESGLYTAESYSELMRSIALEAKNLEKSQARERKSSFVDAYMTGPLELEQQKNQHIMTVLQNQVSVVESVKVLLDGTYQSIESAYNTMNSLADGLRNTLQGFKWNDNLSRNTATQTFSEQSSYYQSLLTKVNNTPKSDMDYSKNIGNLQSFAGTYLESAKSYYGASTEYWKIYDAVTTKLSGLQIDTQTDSDIYKEQLLVQKEIVNKNQLEIDALTLSNSMIGELISVLSLVQAADDLAYKQESVAQNMTIAQLDEIVSSISAGSAEVGSMTVEIVSTLNEIISQSANTADSFTSSVTSSMSSTEAAINSMSSIVGSSIAGTNSNITSMSAGINSSIAGTNSNISASSAGLNTSIAGTNSNLTSMSAGLNESITGTNDNIIAVNDGLSISIAGTNSNISASSAGLNMGISLLSSGLTSSISGTNSNINVLSGVLGTATAGTNNSIISMADKLLAPITGNTTSISTMATDLFSAAAKTDSGLAIVSSSLTTVSSGIFSTSASVNTMSSNVVGAIGGTGTLLNSLISAAYANAANQINVQQAIYNAEASATNVQIGKLDLQNQLAQLAIKNVEYQSQLLNASKYVLDASYLNEQMQIALLTTLANYAAYQASLTGSGLNADATANWYLSEINRIVNGGYNHWVKAGGYAEAIYNKNNELVGYSAGIYNYSSGMYGYLQAIYNKMGTSSSYLGGFASGGEVTGPGWFMAGENGPEPVLLKGGSASVTSNGDFTGSVDTNTKVTAAGLSALLTEMKAMRKELAQIRSTGQRAVAAPARN